MEFGFQFIRFFLFLNIKVSSLFHFFQNVIGESALSDTIINNSLRFDRWEQHCNPSPAYLDMKDFQDIIESDCIFARKLRRNGSESEKELLQKILKQSYGVEVNQLHE